MPSAKPRGRALAIAALSLVTMGMNLPRSADAAFAGRNGRIAFSSYREGQQDIYTMLPDGGGVRNLTDDVEPDFQPAWSPDGEAIAFVSLHVGTSRSSQIYTMNPRGGDRTRLTDFPDGNPQEPAWSPDGETIAFHVSFGGAIDDEIYTIDADGSDLVRLTNNDRSDSNPAWSPDGTRLALVRDASIETMDADGGRVRRVTPDGMLGFDPAWSPDGRWIAFIGKTDAARQYDLYVIRPDGSELRRLDETRRIETSPSWSPDGRRIVYVLTRYYYENDVEKNLICTIRIDGTHRRVLSADSSSRDGFPDWRSLQSDDETA